VSLFLEPSPAGAKYAAAKLGLCQAEVRLPIVPLTEGTMEKIDAAMTHAGLVN